MGNNHQQFIEFNNVIKLSSSKVEELRKNRDSIRETILKYFKENKPLEVAPSFHAQGSFQMNTGVNPLPVKITDENGKEKDTYPYDLDDGVYFIDTIENRKAVTMYHSWIMSAIKDKTDNGAIDKNTCIRLLYADGHNIDLPIYFEELNKENVIPQLAHKTEGFIDSDPIAFYKWFNSESSDQLKRIVRYLKAWKNKLDNSYSTLMPSGMVLTILATENYCPNDRDDISVRDTLQSISDSLNKDYSCYRPTVKTDEDLLSKYSKDHFVDKLSKFLNSATNAISEESQKEACKMWQKHLGDRFSCKNIEDEELASAKSYSTPAIVIANAHNA